MSERIAVSLGEWYPIPERDRWIEGSWCLRRKLIFDQHGRALGTYSQISTDVSGYIWHSDYSGFLHIPSEDYAIYWMNGGKNIEDVRSI